MTMGGWIFLTLSWLVIIALCVFTFAKTLGLRIENMLAPLDINTETRKKKRKK